jgi:predicted MFS family arabinose efflux permease
MTSLRALRPAFPILLGASLMLTLSMGIRQSLGIFMQPLTQDIAISISEFTVAIAIQNLAWGFTQPIAGAYAARHGFRPVVMIGAGLYITGLTLMAAAQGFLSIMIGAGVLIGMSLSCIASSVSMAVAARSVPASSRSLVLGIVSAAGSLGALIAAPLGQALNQEYGWRFGIAGFVILSLALIPATWLAGKVDKIPLPPAPSNDMDGVSARTVIGRALGNPSFIVMTMAYFVCGMQLVFLTTHLPTYLAICGMDPMLSAQTLGVIGGFNVIGSLFFGWAGGRWNRLALLGGIYFSRSLILAWYFMQTPTPTMTLQLRRPGASCPGARDIFGVAAAIDECLRRQFQHAVGQRGEKMPVVRDEQHGALELRQRRDQHFLGRHVEMVGRLVEHQKIRRIEQHLRHHQPRLLAARQHPAFLLDVIAGKAEAAGQRAQRALPGLREGILQRLEHRALAVEQIHRVLGEVAHLHAAAERHRAVVGLGAPATSFSSVDLPAPLTPMTHQRSLRRIWKSSPS